MTEYRGALSRVARVTCARALKTARRGMSDARHRWAMGRGTLTPRPMARADPFAPRARYVAVDASFAYAPPQPGRVLREELVERGARLRARRELKLPVLVQRPAPPRSSRDTGAESRPTAPAIPKAPPATTYTLPATAGGPARAPRRPCSQRTAGPRPPSRLSRHDGPSPSPSPHLKTPGGARCRTLTRSNGH